MLLSYSDFINEEHNGEKEFNTTLAEKLIAEIKRNVELESFSLSGMEFTDPFLFKLVVDVRRNSNFNVKSDPHFKQLPWEKFNFKRDGYVVDANTTVKGEETPIIEIVLVLDPSREPHLFSKLHGKMLDILVHETNHLSQLGVNKNPTGEEISHKHDREAAKAGHQYFLLKDEIQSMVEGMYTRSQHDDVPLDYVFNDYLVAFVKDKYITKEEYADVMETWIKYAAEHYPDAKFSNKANKVLSKL